MIATVYGSHTDRLKNVPASGSATIVDEGHTYGVDHPEVTPVEAAAAYFRAEHQRTHRPSPSLPEGGMSSRPC